MTKRAQRIPADAIRTCERYSSTVGATVSLCQRRFLPFYTRMGTRIYCYKCRNKYHQTPTLNWILAVFVTYLRHVDRLIARVRHLHTHSRQRALAQNTFDTIRLTHNLLATKRSLCHYVFVASTTASRSALAPSQNEIIADPFIQCARRA